MVKFSDTIFEEREELMISPAGDSDPTLRTAHFLKPTTVDVVDHQNVAPFCLNPQPSSTSSGYNIRNLHKKVNFHASQHLDYAWKKWVARLRPQHESTWKKAGIYDAILNSTFNIRRDDGDDALILAFVEKWCPETNTFVFPWGEATISLEDMIVLGGFSVLGELAIDLIDAEKNVILKNTLNCMPENLDQNELVLQMCEENDFEFEHESFLVLWLSRFVFPGRCDSIRVCVYPMADFLARGIKVALAPTVLANIYRDLSLLKGQITASVELNLQDEENSVAGLTSSAPFQLVRVWIWERFIELRPKPNVIQLGEPRYAKWHQIKTLKTIDDDLSLVINSAGNSFQWRPYNSRGLRVYTNRERSVPVDSCSDEDILSYVRCIRVSLLVGLDGTIEQYLPHRIAMQFGIDQDIPGYIANWLHESDASAWENYIRPIDDSQLYIPAQLFEADVTTKYFEWWKSLMFDQQDAANRVSPEKRSISRPTSVKQLVKKSSEDGMKVDVMINTTVADNKHSSKKNGNSQDSPCIVDPFQESEDLPPPPGFPYKYKKPAEAEKCRDNNGIIVQDKMEDEASTIFDVKDDADNKNISERNDKSHEPPCIIDPIAICKDLPSHGFPYKYKKPVEAEICRDNNGVIVQDEMQDDASIIFDVQDDADNKHISERNDKSRGQPCIVDPIKNYKDLSTPPGFPYKYKKPIEAQKCGDNNGVIVQDEMQDEASRIVDVQGKAVAKESEGEVVDGSLSNNTCTYGRISEVDIHELESRIIKLENAFSDLKSKKFSRPIIEEENTIDGHENLSTLDVCM